MRISRLALYDCTSNPHIRMDRIAEFVSDMTGVCTQIHPPPEYDAAGCMVRSIFLPPERWGDAPDGVMPLCDGYMLVHELGTHVRHQDGVFHVLFVGDMMGTYDHDDMRYHGRALISSNPCVISVRGMCEAPARPKKYCIDMMACSTPDQIRNVNLRHAESFLTHDDARLQDVANGYVLQAMLHFETGEAFCTDPDCRMYNSHWQTDLIRTQTSPRLCRRHQGIIRRMAP